MIFILYNEYMHKKKAVCFFYWCKTDIEGALVNGSSWHIRGVLSNFE
jgi:hypothetical protein